MPTKRKKPAPPIDDVASAGREAPDSADDAEFEKDVIIRSMRMNRHVYDELRRIAARCCLTMNDVLGIAVSELKASDIIRQLDEAHAQRRARVRKLMSLRSREPKSAEPAADG